MLIKKNRINNYQILNFRIQNNKFKQIKYQNIVDVNKYFTCKYLLSTHVKCFWIPMRLPFNYRIFFIGHLLF